MLLGCTSTRSSNFCPNCTRNKVTEQQAILEVFRSCLLVRASIIAMDGFARATLWTNQNTLQQYDYNGKWCACGYSRSIIIITAVIVLLSIDIIC